MPETEEEETVENEKPVLQNETAQQILKEIRREVREVIRVELQTTLQFYSDKIDEYEDKVKEYEANMKAFETQCQDVKNNYRNLALKYDVLEQKLNEIEQNRMINCIELCGIDETTNEKPIEIAQIVCSKIGQDTEEIKSAYRKKKTITNVKGERTLQVIVATLKEGCREKWLDAAKLIPLTAQDIGREGSAKIYLRESLAPATAFLLWKAKQELKETGLCKFVWCKTGRVLARKCENEKPLFIKSLRDVERIAKDLRK